MSERQPKPVREVITSRDIVDLKGWTIPKGATLHVITEGPAHPTDGHRVLVVRIDNGTGILKLMPETVIHDTDLKGSRPS